MTDWQAAIAIVVIIIAFLVGYVFGRNDEEISTLKRKEPK